MKRLYGAIIWHIHTNEYTGTETIFLALEKRNGAAYYPGDSWCTFLTGPNFTELTHDDVDRMREYAKNNGITLTTNRVTVRHK